MTEFFARVALGERLAPVGQLRFTQTGPRQFSIFTYDPAWVKDPRAFALQPDMSFEGGPFHASAQPGNAREALAGAFSDAAPDSWGRRLLERAYGKGLSEFEYLTLSDDTCRQGALRFVDDEGKIITGNATEAVPRLLDLQAITAIARAYEQGKEISAAGNASSCGRGRVGRGSTQSKCARRQCISGLPSSLPFMISNRSNRSRLQR